MRKIIIVLLILACSACASSAVSLGYSAVSTGSLVSTGKSLPEQILSRATDSDCSTWNWLFNNKDYVCEQYDIAKTYNRNGF